MPIGVGGSELGRGHVVVKIPSGGVDTVLAGVSTVMACEEVAVTHQDIPKHWGIRVPRCKR